MSKMIIVEGNSNDKDNVRAYMVKGEKGEMGDLNHNDIIDNLTSTETNKVLSANQGKQLKDLIDDVKEQTEKNTTYIADTTNPIYYGADPTGVSDSTNSINQCIQANKGGTINFTLGKYLISGQIELPYNMLEKVSINGNGAKIIASGEFTNIFDAGTNRTDSTFNNVGYVSYVKDLFIDASNATVTNCFHVANGFKDLRIINIESHRTQNGVIVGDSVVSPNDTSIDNCLFYGNGSEFEGIGVYLNCTDNYITNTRLYGFRNGFIIKGYSTITNTHVLLRWSNQTTDNFDPIERNSQQWNEVYPLTNFGIIHSECKITGSYADSTYKFLQIEKAVDYCILTNSIYYNARTNVDCMIIDIVITPSNFICSNNFFTISKNENGIGINIREKLNNHSQIKILNNDIKAITNLTNPFDLIRYDVFNHQVGFIMEPDTWYVVGLLTNILPYTTFWINLFIYGYMYSLKITDNGNSGTLPIEQYLDSSTSTRYTFGVVTDPETNNKYLCLKSNERITGVKTSVSLINSSNLSYYLIPCESGGHPVNPNRELSAYTNLTPEETLLLKSSIDN